MKQAIGFIELVDTYQVTGKDLPHLLQKFLIDYRPEHSEYLPLNLRKKKNPPRNSNLRNLNQNNDNRPYPPFPYINHLPPNTTSQTWPTPKI